MKKHNKALILISFLLFSSLFLFAQQHYSGPIESCKDTYDLNPNDTTEYIHFSANSNNNNNDIQRYYKVVYTHPGCDTTSYQTVFFDDFDGSTLDTTRWRTKELCPAPFDTLGCGCPSNQAKSEDDRGKVWSTGNVSVSGGFLHLKTAKIEPPLVFICVNEDGDTITPKRRFSSAQVISKNTFPNGFGGGCFKYGKITVRAKVVNGVNNTVGAIWFWGWAAEVDMIEVCQTDCDEMQTNRHEFTQNPLHDCHPGVNDNLAWPKDHSIGGGIYNFHNYTMEWTPYKIIISVDGVEKRTFVRFADITQEPITGTDGGTTTTIHPMNCNEFTPNQTDTLWQHLLWGYLSNPNANLDLLMSVGIKDLENNNDFGGEMLVDWVKIEQQIPNTTISRQNPGSTPDLLCINETAQFKATVAGSPTYPVSEWTVSSNLQIQSISPNTQVVTVKAIGPNGPAWVQARLWNTNNCFGTNIRKPLSIGLPFPPPQVYADRTCKEITINVTNYSPAFNYQWQILTPGFAGYPINNGASYIIVMPDPAPNVPTNIDYRLTVTSSCGGTTTLNASTITKPCKKWELKVYPNPSNTYANFELINFTQEEVAQNLEITLVDANFNVKKTMPVSNFVETMDVSNIAPGYHYAYIVISGENIISSQFLIQH